MKKVLLVLALVAVYGIAISNVSAKVITVEKSKVTVVEGDDNTTTTVEKEEKKGTKTTKATATKEATPAKACCGEKPAEKASCPEAVKKSCAAAEKDAPAKACCGSKK